MIKVVAVKFRAGGKSYYFDPLDFELSRGMHVIVETTHGLEYATAAFSPIEVTDDRVVLPLKPIIRIATEEDDRMNEENHKKEKEASVICKEKIEKYGLEMKLVDTEYTFDRNKLLFYFTADGRIDFRELVKELASVFRTRIELRQIGVRDETKIKGGIGICGRALCCQTYLSDFAPVSIRMAKDQNLSLNPTKISGACGRLMCCLNNEQATYEYLNAQLPKRNAVVTTPEGLVGRVQSTNTLKQTVKVLIGDEDEKELRDYAVGELVIGDHPEAGAALKQSLVKKEAEQIEEVNVPDKPVNNKKKQNNRSEDRARKKNQSQKAQDQKSQERKSSERKPQDHKSKERKSQDHKSSERRSQNHRSDGKPHYRKRRNPKQEGHERSNGSGAEEKREN